MWWGMRVAFCEDTDRQRGHARRELLEKTKVQGIHMLFVRLGRQWIRLEQVGSNKCQRARLQYLKVKLCPIQ